jgi:hypothetical protein
VHPTDRVTLPRGWRRIPERIQAFKVFKQVLIGVHGQSVGVIRNQSIDEAL